jgi:hypothetical protein
MATDSTWEQRLVEIWTSIDRRPAAEFVAAVDEHTAELSADDGVGFFERAAARDSTGSSDLAVPLYRQALDRGLIGERRRRAVIQLASSLRNLGAATESVALLRAEQGSPPTLSTTPSRASWRWPSPTSARSGRRSASSWRRSHRTCPATSDRSATTPASSSRAEDVAGSVRAPSAGTAGWPA